MDELAKLVERYGGSVEQFKGLTKITMPVELPKPIDVGFATEYFATWLGRLFPFLRHFEMLKGLYVYGDRAEVLSRIIGRDDTLCSALRFVFDQYAFAVECSNKQLVARLNAISRSISDDPSGGWSLISNLATIARRLGELDYHEFDAMPRSIFAWGPGRSRNMSTAAIFVAVFCIPLYLLTHFHVRPPG